MAKDVPPREEPPADGAKSEILRTPFAAGEVIGGRYRLDHVLAEGGMGVIVAATHLELDETVAIKFLKHDFAVDPEVVGRFAREAKAAARLKSEYTATVHDVGLSPERGPYIVMECLDGEDFERMLQRHGPINFSRATELMMQACVGIAVAHANSIIHRDIKPANLFLMRTEHGAPTVKVLDFGVSKATLTGKVFGGAISLVKTQSLVGSPAYMSPEQLRGSDELDATADIWSLGAVLYQLITGTIPFNGRSVPELFAAMLENDPRSVHELVPEVPIGLSDTIMRCLARDPRDRWQSVADLVVALSPYAPRRARASVDRAVAVSRAAGLIASDPAHPFSSSRPPGGADAEPLARLASNPALPRLFQTLVDTHGGVEPPSNPKPPDTLPRLFQTLVDTHGGGGETVRRAAPSEEPPRRWRLPLALSLAAIFVTGAAIYIWRARTDEAPAVAASSPPAETTPLPAPEPQPPASASALAVDSPEPPPPPSASAVPEGSLQSAGAHATTNRRPPASTPAGRPTSRASSPPASAALPPPSKPADSGDGDRVHRAIEDRK